MRIALITLWRSPDAEMELWYDSLCIPTSAITVCGDQWICGTVYAIVVDHVFRTEF